MLGLPKGSNPKQPIETEELRKKRGVSSGLTSAQPAARRWVWTSLGFGEVIHTTKTQREEARAREIAASLAPPPSSSPSPASPTATSSSSSAVPDAPPLAASPAPKPAASPSKPAKQPNAVPSSLGLNQFLSLLQSKAADAVPTPPSIPPTQLLPASCVETHVAVHLLPHYSQPSAAAILFGASPAPTPNPPTVVYTAQTNAYPRVRVKVRTFFDLTSLIPKKKDSSSSDDSSLNAASLSNALKSELKARKEKLEAEKAAKDRASMSPSEQAKYDEAQKEKEKREKEEQEEKIRKEEARKNKPKPVGPPPQTMELEVEVNSSLRSVIQQIVDFYQAYEVELDPDSIRLASSGKEITKCELPILRPEDEKRVIQVREVNKQPAAQKEDASRSQSQQNADRYQQQYYGQGGSGQSILPRDAAAAISAASRLIREAMWHALNPGAAVFLGGAHHIQNSTQTDRERYFRNNTMLAECALTPTKESIAAITAASEGTSMQPVLPEFPLLMVYDDCSRFAFDATALPSDVTLTADALGATMLHADNKWVTLRANKSYSSGKHSWKVKMDRCQGGNTFLGVCTDKMPQNNYIGADANGYGYYGCGNIYRLGSSSAYGQSYRTGDIMTVHLDMDKRTLSFDKNDAPLGVAFSDLPDKVYPAFSLYTRNDHIQLIEFGQ